MDFVVVQLFGLCHSLEQQDHSPPDRRNIDGLEGRIQHQHRFLHDRRLTMHGRRGEQMMTFAIGERQDCFTLPTYTVIRWVRVHPSGPCAAPRNRPLPGAGLPEPLSELPPLPLRLFVRPSNTHRGSLQWLIHHLPVKPEGCQLGGLDGSYTRPERCASAPSWLAV